MRSFTNRQTEYGILSNNTTTANLALGSRLMNDADRYLINRFNLNEATDTTQTTVAAQQNYKLPYNLNKLIDVYVTIGTIRYKLKEIPSRDIWDRINYVQYQTNIPEYFFQYNNELLIFPVPSTTGYTITQNYKRRFKDLSQADYTTGTVSVTLGSTTITGSGTTFTRAMIGDWIQIASPSGDNEWYQISGFTSATVLTLLNPYQGTTVSGASYTIAEMSLLDEQYQDLPMYRALMTYYSSKVKDPDIFNMYKDLYKTGVKIMDLDLTSKTENMVIDDGMGYQRLINPNFYLTL